jgi:membrane-bound lytic murein transglycosylase B
VLSAVLEAVARPAEAKPWHEYRRLFVTPDRIDGGAQFWDAHRASLERATTLYGVPPEVVVAILGVETRYGRSTGAYRVFEALATLAFSPGRRADFFRRELEQLLLLAREEGLDPFSLKGSYAGAMGLPQFISSSFRRYAVDFDGDGRRDIWSSDADVFASIANFLQQKGWRPGERWGREVDVPAKVASQVRTSVSLRTQGCRAVRELSDARPLPGWQQLGVRLPKGRPLPRSDITASLLDGGSRTFLVYRNYDALLAYNCANSYALSVALLSDRLAGAPGRSTSKAKAKPKSGGAKKPAGTPPTKTATAPKP